MSKEETSHPPTSVMVQTALEVLHNRRGTSFHAIKQYIFSMYHDVDPVRYTPFIKRYLVNAISSGQIVRTKGNGMSASFKLVPAKTSSKKEKKPSEAAVDEKKTVVKKPKKAEQPSENSKKAQKPTAKAQKPASDQKVKKKRVSITATKVRKGASKVAKK